MQIERGQEQQTYTTREGTTSETLGMGGYGFFLLKPVVENRL
jgi:hypothetical protein